FLYVHFMDMHMPRYLPEDEPRFPVVGYDWRRRFKATGEPRFHPERRRWVRADARDFTELDRRHFAAVYDSRLSYTDEELVRLLTTVREDDPDLRRTLVVVASDHGEELGEAGRTDHTDSLADGAQHVPWIVTGGPVGAGQLCDRFTENIDIAPTLLALLGVPLPPGTRMDGRPQLDADGRRAARGGRAAGWRHAGLVRTDRRCHTPLGPAACRMAVDGTRGDRSSRPGRRAPIRLARRPRWHLPGRGRGPTDRTDAVPPRLRPLVPGELLSGDRDRPRRARGGAHRQRKAVRDAPERGRAPPAHRRTPAVAGGSGARDGGGAERG